jgi:ribonucleoside-diphosphate reductase alpha chain
MKIARFFSKPGIPVKDQIVWKTLTAEILDGKTGEVIFRQEGVEVPEQWSQNATNILAQKYFRKTGVPQVPFDCKIQDRNRSSPYNTERSAYVKLGGEYSAAQVFHRFAECWTHWGHKEGLIKTVADAQVFYDELFIMLARQMAAPNSPQWFNTGLYWAYGIEGPDTGQWIATETFHQGQRGVMVEQIRTSYIHPQPHACFIQPVKDDLVNPGGIMDLAVREARLFKHGSGTGTNFSTIRAKGEKLSGGGVSSGLMSFLKIGDVVAGSIASGGTTRRAAKMVCLDLDHPEVEDFIELKVKEERKARALAIGSQILAKSDGGEAYDENAWEGEAISTVTGQNANNSLRITNQFMYGLSSLNGMWAFRERSEDQKETKSVPISDLWNKICLAAWACGDPGLQFHDTINEWHTCPNDGPIRASNPCSEYMFLDNTACNLASLNLVSFMKDGSFDIPAFEQAVRLWTIVLEISVHMASFPSAEIALGSYNYRTLGLGYANLGGLLMRSGIPYDSDSGRAYAAAVTALMTGISYVTSADMAAEVGPFPRWAENKDSMRRVLENHAACLYDSSLRDVSTEPLRCDMSKFEEIRNRAQNVWSEVLKSDKGFRNAQVTLLAPTGTIRLTMDCDTSGIEPAYALVEKKKLAGGGDMTIPNPGIVQALIRLGYTPAQASAIEAHVKEHGTLSGIEPRNGQPFISPEHLSVFHCADEISPIGHIAMVAAVQPFLSGGVSKTINIPNHSSVGDVSEFYESAWKLGLKSVSLYRDGCKVNQPLSSLKDLSFDSAESIKKVFTRGQAAEILSGLESHIDEAERISLDISIQKRGVRENLPPRRGGWAQKFKVDGHSLYLRTGEYPDGRLGEIWVNLSREGSTVRSIMECFAKAISLGIQYGVPLDEYVDAFIYTKFEPAGIVEGSEDLRLCSSIIDLIFRTIGIEYLNRSDLSVRNGKVVLESPIPVPSKPQPKDSNVCWSCGNASLIRTGSCITCSDCAANTGCG